MTREIKDSVTVVTGASGGIGRATALALAGRGGKVVVAARRAAALATLAEECRAAGGDALAVALDVCDEAAVRVLAQRAMGRFGRIDAWINNAAVIAYGRFEQTPSEVFRRVIDTNVFGYVHGARAVLPVFRAQGRGVLVNVASVVGKTGQAYASAYATSKFAIVGLSTTLRQELADERDIHVVTVLPASTDTPLFRHGANYMGLAVTPIAPIADPRQVARAIVGAIRRPQREIYIGTAAQAARLGERLAPVIVERVTGRFVKQWHFARAAVVPSAGNVFESLSDDASVDGGWRHTERRPAAAWLALAGVLITGLLGARRLRHGGAPRHA